MTARRGGEFEEEAGGLGCSAPTPTSPVPEPSALKRSDEHALRHCLEQVVSDVYGRRAGAAITSIYRNQWGASSASPACTGGSRTAPTHACETVTVQLATGVGGCERNKPLALSEANGEPRELPLRVFLKDFGPSSLPSDEMDHRRERELRVYQNLLMGAGLDTARYYGSVWDEKEGRYWLLLEFVDGVPLSRGGSRTAPAPVQSPKHALERSEGSKVQRRDQNDFGLCTGEACLAPTYPGLPEGRGVETHGYASLQYWVEAGRWLGRMQGYFAGQSSRLEACGFLVRHDYAFFWSKAELALQAVSHISAPLAERLAAILSRYERLVVVMASQPATLVHGSFRPRDILVALRGPGAGDRGSGLPAGRFPHLQAGTRDPRSPASRICPIDWELAGLGAPLYDLAFISDGLEPPARDLIWGAYLEEIAKYGLAVPDRREMRYIVDCFRLHKVMQELSGSVDRKFPESAVARLVDRAESLSLRLSAGDWGLRAEYQHSHSVPGTQSSALDLAEHRAVRAWIGALREAGALRGAAPRRPGRIEPRSIETLQEEWQSAVYRLEGVGLGGSSVIAKRCRPAVALVERAIYEEILSRLPVSAPRYYGFAQEDDECCWLFTEDAGGERYSPLQREHRVLGAGWLGLMHTASERVIAGAGRTVGGPPLSLKALLPDRGPGYYLEHLRSARREILKVISKADLDGGPSGSPRCHSVAWVPGPGSPGSEPHTGFGLTPASRITEDPGLPEGLLGSIVRRLDALELYWSEVERFCAKMPVTLVHGDFRRKNVFVRPGTGDRGSGIGSARGPVPGPRSMAILPTNWETAGWGVPAIDLAQVDMGTYWPVVRQWWPDLAAQDIEQLARVGQIFQWLASLDFGFAAGRGEIQNPKSKILGVHVIGRTTALRLNLAAQMPDPIRIVRSLEQRTGKDQGSVLLGRLLAE